MPWKNPEEIVAMPAPPPSVETMLSRLTADVQRLVDVLTPGTRGIPGAQEIPGVRVYAQTVSTTPTLIAGNAQRKRLSLHVQSGVTVYVLDSPAETSADGFPVELSGTIDLECRENIWLVTASGTSNVRAIEESS